MQMLLNNRYRIIRTLGGGGFGETFLAEDTQMPSLRRCVIKQLKPIHSNPQIYQLVQQRFQREAAILEALGEGHQQIPRLYAYFSENSQFYLVQEYIEGQTLTAKLQEQGPLNESAVKEILLSLLPVLDYIHSKGIVHRDIKPDNILIRHADQKPVLIDFGAVKETIGTMVSPSGNSTRSIVIGTPGFMPSEQSIGRPMFASDVYSLGLTAIYLLTGKLPQELATDPATGAILWHQFASITPDFAAVLDKAVQFYASDRFISAQAMQAALQTAASQIPPTISEVPPTIITPVGPAVAPTQSPSSPPTTPVHTISVSPVGPLLSSPQGSGQRGIVFGSLIAGGLIGASVIIGLALNKPQQIPVNQPLAPQKTVVLQPSSAEPSAEPEPLPVSEEPPIPDNSPAVDAEPFTPQESPILEADLPAATQPSPTEAIRNYYTSINQGQYQTAWSLLSPNFQNNRRLHPNGYSSYLDWWGGKVQGVSLEQVILVESDAETAAVDAKLQYFMKNGKVIPGSVRFLLSWDAHNSRWIVADAK